MTKVKPRVKLSDDSWFSTEFAFRQMEAASEGTEALERQGHSDFIPGKVNTYTAI